jgi:hypothetical protein
LAFLRPEAAALHHQFLEDAVDGAGLVGLAEILLRRLEDLP